MDADKESKCHYIIHSHAVAAAAGNAVPVPGLGIAADMVTMTSMTMSLCAVFGGSLTEEAAKALAIATGLIQAGLWDLCLVDRDQFLSTVYRQETPEKYEQMSFFSSVM